MTEPSGGTPRSDIPVVLRIMLAVLLLLPGVAGLAVLLLLAASWAIQGFHFDVSDRAMVPLFLFLAEVCILFSAVTVAIVLRYARWLRAPDASLALAIVSLTTIVLGHLMMADALGNVDIGDIPGLVLLSGLMALAVSGPPFFHWRNARKQGRLPANDGL